MSEKVTEKEIYRLWWEYLKRSDDYKHFCDWLRKQKDGIDSELQENIALFKDGKAHPFTHLIYAFKNVHTISFDEWWEWRKLELKEIKKNRQRVAIGSHFVNFKSDFQHCVDDFKKAEGREPSIYEFKTLYINRIKNQPYRLIIEVNIASNKTDVLKKEFDRVIRTKKKDPIIKSYEKMFNEAVFPMGRIRYDELKRYLAVYDLRKTGMKYQNIIKKIGTKAQKARGCDPDIESQFRRDFRNAERIIKNAEKGYFPISDK
jgi:hypothetical protein